MFGKWTMKTVNYILYIRMYSADQMVTRVFVKVEGIEINKIIAGKCHPV